MEQKTITKAKRELELDALVLEEQAEAMRLFARQLGNVHTFHEIVALEKQTGAFDTRQLPKTIRRIYSDLEELHNERSMT